MTEIDKVVTALKTGEYNGVDIMRAYCSLKSQQNKINQLEVQVRRFMDLDCTHAALREDLDDLQLAIQEQQLD